MRGRAILTVLLSGMALGLALATAGGASTQAPRPDLTAAVETSPSKWPKRSINVTVTVKNIGEASCEKSVCFVFIRHAHSPRETFKVVKKSVRSLNAGDQFTFSFPVEFGLGLFEIEAVADRAKKIAESDETNNGTKITVQGR